MQIRKTIWLGVAVVPTLMGCGNDDIARQNPGLGSLELALSVGGELTVESVDVSLESVEPAYVRNLRVDVSDPNATVSVTEFGLPAATYAVELVANVLDDPSTSFNESTIACLGSVEDVVVTAGQVALVDELVIVCTRDGGEVQLAGGISINANVDYDVVNTCPDLFHGVSVAPLDASVGRSVSLNAVVDGGVNVEWSAAFGSFSEDGSSFICPDVAGDVRLIAVAERADGCTQTFEQVVTCHSTYRGECESLPSKFALHGECPSLSTPCHLVQDGCSWEAVCNGSTVLSGEASDADTFPFLQTYGRGGSSARICTLDAVDGELVGSCDDQAGNSCTLASETEPEPSAQCLTLPDVIPNVTACGVTYESCEVSQDGCAYQAVCAGGEVIKGTARGSVLRWDPTIEGNAFRCEGEVVDGSVVGSCTQSGRGITEPILCDDYTATVPDGPYASCEATLPSEGFALSGCGLDDTCFAYQAGCVWEVACADKAFGGIARASNAFDFEVGGKSCTATVEDGVLTGNCEDDNTSCNFASVAPEADPSCFELPAQVSSSGCGSSLACSTVQNGCDWVASCASGEMLVGTATETGVSFPGLSPGWLCSADLNPAGDALGGGCERENDDGSVSECRDLTDRQDARLVLTWPSTN